jgi:hypothetical protein
MFVGPKALVLPRMLIEAAQYPAHFDDLVQNIVQARFGHARTIIQAAVEAGELPGGTLPDLIIDAIMGRVISLIVLTRGGSEPPSTNGATTTPPRSPISSCWPSRTRTPASGAEHGKFRSRVVGRQ